MAPRILREKEGVLRLKHSVVSTSPTALISVVIYWARWQAWQHMPFTHKREVTGRLGLVVQWNDLQHRQGSVIPHYAQRDREETLRRLTDWTLSAFRMSHHSCSVRLAQVSARSASNSTLYISTKQWAHSISICSHIHNLSKSIKIFGNVIFFFLRPCVQPWLWLSFNSCFVSYKHVKHSKVYSPLFIFLVISFVHQKSASCTD